MPVMARGRQLSQSLSGRSAVLQERFEETEWPAPPIVFGRCPGEEGHDVLSAMRRACARRRAALLPRLWCYDGATVGGHAEQPGGRRQLTRRRHAVRSCTELGP